MFKRNTISLMVATITATAACSPARRAPSGDDAGMNGSGSDAGTGSYCSSDLHDVVDDQGNIVATCPADQGCANGQCVPACMAAAASQGSVGCDFVVATPSFFPNITPPCFAVFLANNWPLDATITIDRDGHSYSATTYGRVPDGTANAAAWPALAGNAIATNGVAVLFLSSDPDSHNLATPMTCPVAPAIGSVGGTAIYSGVRAATGRGTAWHITTTMPVSGYDILPYGGGPSLLPSAELLLPTTAWGTNYVAAGPMPSTGPGWGQIVAAQDATTVMITPSGSLPAGANVTSAPAHQTTIYQLDAGQYIQWQDAGDMTGSVIVSDRPVAFTGGTGYLCLTSATSKSGGCDSAHQMIPPISALGWEYVAPPYATRRADLQEEAIRYRFVGAVDGTQLVYDPPIAGAPATLAAGAIAELETYGAFTIKSQDAMHPFYVAQYMAGCELNVPMRQGFLGDEEFVNILPPAQWLSSYVFFTDPSYPTTNLVVVRKRTSAGFADVTIDCRGTISGWSPVGTSGDYEITNVDLARGMPIGTCTSGRHVATSSGPFGLMVWGLDIAASYAYPAGGNVGKINPVVILRQSR